MDSQEAWESYYKNTNHNLIYPDENLIRIIEKIYQPSWQKALDFGCGNGRNLRYLKTKNIPFLYGLDFSQEIIRKNQERPAGIVYLHYQNHSHLPFPDDDFDLVICWGVLHYNPKPIREFLLREFRRVLKSDGYLVGTFRSNRDTYFYQSEVKNAFIEFFEEQQIYEELKDFTDIKLSHVERTLLGDLQTKIAHYLFVSKK
ncbi:MAG: class I SAM-dependent methyltransferase [Leptospiraceae bacterium]|nr:class I SAM-dependent methyltransferase [Leptospiraceae bacterium]MDW7975125.1 class I SAM-dependent methyltransferase [Leptospiraceae bacterium]